MPCYNEKHKHIATDALTIRNHIHRTVLCLDCLTSWFDYRESKEIMNETEQLANEHWKFIEKLILIQREDITSQDMKLLEFMYKESFIHGYGHCMKKYICKED